MASAVVYEGDVQRTQPTGSGLFAGQKLWFSRGVPSRLRFIEEALQNGAQVVQLEQQADIKLVDHAKKNQAPGTFSYRYVELSIKRGRLEDLEDHRVGSGSRVDRPVGSVITASKGSRNKFTDEEDQILWDWITPYIAKGGAWKGNEIYKQLEAQYPNHTFQSWRDRWMKHTQFQKRHCTTSAPEAVEEAESNSSTLKRKSTETHGELQRANIGIVQTRPTNTAHENSTVPTMGNQPSLPAVSQPGARDLPVSVEIQWQDIQARAEPHNPQIKEPQEVAVNKIRDEPLPGKVVPADDPESSVGADGSMLPMVYNFTQNEARMLYKATCHILDARPDKLNDSWTDVAKEHGHTKEAWQAFFYEVIVPEYRKRNNLEDDADLETHVKTKIREERAAKETEVSREEETDPETTESQAEEEMIKAADAEQDLKLSHSEESIRNEDQQPVPLERPKEQLRGEIFDNMPTLHDPVSTSTAQYRHPKPNESRKLSPSKRSQSISSQSKSISTSQPSQVSQPLAFVPEVRKMTVAETSLEPAQVRNEPSYIHAPTCTVNGEDPLLESTQHPVLHPVLTQLEISQTSRTSPDYEGDSTQFVTQFSHGGRTTPTESPDNLEDIPFRAPSPIELIKSVDRSESPLFLPEEPDVQDLEAHSGAETRPAPIGSPSAVRLSDDDVDSEELRMSEYAPSEITSEGVQFESHVRLKQAWETAPDDLHPEDIAQDDVDESKEIKPEIENENLSDIQDKAPPVDTVEIVSSRVDLVSSSIPHSHSEDSGTARRESTDSGFETALTRQQTETSAYHDGDEVDKSQPEDSTLTRGNLDTQALFQKPTQIAFSELAAIPEPPDGWDDEELISESQIEHPIKNANQTEAADWTLPLPDPSIDDDDEEGAHTSPKESDTDIDNWLAAQPVQYPSITALLLKPLSHRALETATMDLELASSILSRMVQRYEKGKYPAHQSMENIKKLPKRERKITISQIMEELVPVDLRRCWTREDDKALIGTGARKLAAVIEKHGKDDVYLRFEFLGQWYAD